MNSVEYFAFVLTLSLLATITCGLRYYSRRLKNAPFGWDDGFLVAAWVALVCSNVNAALMYLYAHVGEPYETIPNDKLPIAKKCFFASTLMYFAVMYPVKLSVLSLYSRVWEQRAAKGISKAIWVMRGLSTAWLISCLFVTAFRCTPVRKALQHDLTGTCLDSSLVFRGIIIANLLTDVFILAIPMMAIQQLFLASKTQRLGVTLLFGAGSWTILVVILRLIYFDADLKLNDLSALMADCAMWTIVEPAVTIISANLTCLKPLYVGIAKWAGILSDEKSSNRRYFSSGKIDTPLSPMSPGARSRRATYCGPDGRGTVINIISTGEDDILPLRTSTRSSDDYNFSGTLQTSDDWATAFGFTNGVSLTHLSANGSGEDLESALDGTTPSTLPSAYSGSSLPSLPSDGIIVRQSVSVSVENHPAKE